MSISSNSVPPGIGTDGNWPSCWPPMVVTPSEPGRSATFCLGKDPLPDAPLDVATVLVDLSPYDLANDLFERMEDTLDYRHRLRFASSVSEEDPTLAGVERAMSLIRKAIEQVETRYGSDPAGRSVALSQCFRREAGVLQWRWQLTLLPADLDRAIAAHERALEQSTDARNRGGRRLSAPWHNSVYG